MAGLVGAITVGLLLTVLWISFLRGLPGTADARLTLDNYAALYSNPFVVTTLINTLQFALMALVTALFFGLPIAWLVERTDLPAKPMVYASMTLGLLMPGLFLAMGWLFLLHKRIGVVNRWIAGLTADAVGPVDIGSAAGMGWVQGLALTALVFILTSSMFRSMDPALEEAAAMHGAAFGRVLRRITLPVLFPGIMGSALYVFTIAIASFDVPAFLGLSNRVYTFSTFVYLESGAAQGGLPEYGFAGAMGASMIVVGIALAHWYGRVIARANQYQVVTGKGYRPRPSHLGRYAWLAWAFIGGYLVLAQLLPLLLLIWAALVPFFQPPSWSALRSVSLGNFQALPVDLLLRGAEHTFVLMLVTPTLVLLVSLAFSWTVTRSTSRFRGLLDGLAFLPHSVPEIVFGIGALLAALFLLRPLQLYGSLALLVVGYVVVRLSFGTRLLNAALLQIHGELLEAATVSGARGWQVAGRVVVPLVLPALLNGWLWLALATYRELVLATVLSSPNNITLSVVLWTIWNGGEFGAAAATSLVLLCLFLPWVVAYWVISSRIRGVRA